MTIFTGATLEAEGVSVTLPSSAFPFPSAAPNSGRCGPVGTSQRQTFHPGWRKMCPNLQSKVEVNERADNRRTETSSSGEEFS